MSACLYTTLSNPYVIAAEGTTYVRITPMAQVNPDDLTAFLAFHQFAQEKAPGFLKPLSVEAVQKSDVMVQMKSATGNLLAQCLLTQGDNMEKSEFAHYPADHKHGKTLIISSLAGLKHGNMMMTAIVNYARKNGYEGLLAKTHSRNSKGIDFFDANYFTNGITYTAPGENYAAHYFYFSLTKSMGFVAVPVSP
ncbi:MAG: hypothetical protein J0L77_03815 [Alphaproteobacteria bacterium]|nr:hypothetical protein [Alphaproteobacteria bacterium]